MISLNWATNTLPKRLGNSLLGLTTLSVLLLCSGWEQIIHTFKLQIALHSSFPISSHSQSITNTPGKTVSRLAHESPGWNAKLATNSSLPLICALMMRLCSFSHQEEGLFSAESYVCMYVCTYMYICLRRSLRGLLIYLG